MNLSPLASPIRLALAAGFLATTVSASVVVDFVSIGNAGNAADPASGGLYGAVAYEYNIAKNETTIAQYAAFLNAVAQTDKYSLYNTSMNIAAVNGISRSGESGSYAYTVATGSENKPIVYVSWFDAARYCNWLQNGQPTGLQDASTTERGAYTLDGLTSGTSVVKNAGASVWIPSEDEWYKAAYYDPTKGGTGGYWLHANQSDTLPGNTLGDAGAVNFNDGDLVGNPNRLTEVGVFGAGSTSYYGTNDQGGNVSEWTTGIVSSDPFGQLLANRGGSWISCEECLRSTTRNSLSLDFENQTTGFRIASGIAIVPEPGTWVLAMVFSVGLVSRRRR